MLTHGHRQELEERAVRLDAQQEALLHVRAPQLPCVQIK